MAYQLNYRQYPFLQDIESGQLDNFELLCDEDTEGYNLCKNLLAKFWDYAASRVRANVCIPSRTYIQAVEKSAPAFDRIIDKAIGKGDIQPEDWVDNKESVELTDREKMREKELYKLCGNAYGCYLSQDGQMVVYGICEEPVRHIFFIDVVQGKVTRAFVQYAEDYAYFVTSHPNVASVFREMSAYPIVIISQLQHECNLFIMFERYARTETRYVPPKTRTRVDPKSLSTSYNETRLKIHIRDSRYFTNIIREEGFTVSSHLRLQPKKVNGEWTHELIVIKEYEKHGYHRQATISK